MLNISLDKYIKTNEDLTLDNFPIIHINKYICLREPRLTNNDIVNFYNCYNEPEIARFLPNSVIPSNYNDAKNSIERYRADFINKNSCFWFIVDKRYNKMIGNIGLQSYDTYNRKTEICYEISNKYTRLGIATCAVLHSLNYAFKELSMHRVEAMTTIENRPSGLLLLKSGFTYEGKLESYRFFKGKYIDVNMFGYTLEQYEQDIEEEKVYKIMKYYTNKSTELYYDRMILL